MYIVLQIEKQNYGTLNVCTCPQVYCQIKENISILWFVSLCVCMFFCEQVHMCLCACESACGGQRTASGLVS